MKIAVLGSTGSIGTNVIEVARNLADIQVYGISANKNLSRFNQYINELNPQIGVITDEQAYNEFKRTYPVDSYKTRLLCGNEGLHELVSNDQVDVVVNGLSGLSGLLPTLIALKEGKKIASANKESIIMGWHIIRELMTYHEQLIPVDSEHSALFQSMKGEQYEDIRRVIITASGGAVYSKSAMELKSITARDCLVHPTWNMGNKITIDSATLMNKGLEVIEAHNLFGINYDNIDVYIHPQSIVHGMVEYIDGSIISYLATQDMKIPIQYALTHPQRKSSPSKLLDIEDMSELKFSLPDNERFPCLKLAVDVGRLGGISPVIMCAADEIAVEAFMDGKIHFNEIPQLIKKVLDKDIRGESETFEGINSIYDESKSVSREIIMEMINK
ncbi:1-deoxy-D-xylulose-5-phosphate reductoisomerase [Elusimicrobiota bacterium]